MHKKIYLFFIFSITLFGFETLKPTYSVTTVGNAQSLVVQDKKLFIGTDNGEIEIFDINQKKILNRIVLPKIKDFMGDTIPAKIYSIDVLKNKILIVSQGMKGYRNIFLYENNILKKIIDIEKKYFIQKATFVDDNSIVFALLSNQIGKYDFKSNQLEYLVQISQSSFSHFMISEDKKTIATTDESGIVRIFSTEDAQVLKELNSINLDKVYQLDYKNGNILTAGQDRKSVFYGKSGHYSIDFDFLLYSCALNKNGSIGAIAYNEDNDVIIFNTKTKKYLYNLTGQKATLTQILFISDNELYISSDSNQVNYFNLKEK